MRATLAALLAALIAPAGAVAGGFATVGLSSTPDGIATDDPWGVELTILQHGRSEAPLSGLRPIVVVSGAGGERRSFVASPTGRPGVYRARVVFPSAGRWRLHVNDGFSPGVHTYPPVDVSDSRRSAAVPVSDSNGGRDVGLALLAAAAAGLGAGLAARLLRRPRGTARAAEAR